MAGKSKKYDPTKVYKFDVGKGEYVQKQEFIDSSAKPNAIIYARVSDQKQVDE